MEKTDDKVLNMLIKSSNYISGENISKELNISRTAVWKTIEKLRTKGYLIDAVTNKGYILLNKQSIITKELINDYISLNNNFYILETVNSTNLYANSLVIDGVDNGTVVIAKEQTQGSGRLGRSFSSPINKGIYYSYILEPNCTAERLSLLTSYAGLCVCDTLKELTGKEFYIKWPNDIIYDNKKVCGILTRLVTNAETMEISHAIIGIGINVLQESFEEELKDKAISLFQITGENYSMSTIIAILTHKLNEMFIENNQLIKDNVKYLDKLRKLSCTIGKEVSVISPLSTRYGVAVDISQDGGLVVDFNGNCEVISAGEVSVRGVLGYNP